MICNEYALYKGLQKLSQADKQGCWEQAGELRTNREADNKKELRGDSKARGHTFQELGYRQLARGYVM